MTRSNWIAAASLCIATAAGAQDSTVARVTLDDRGLTLAAPARSTEMNLRLYIQPLVTLIGGDGNGGGIDRVGMQIRRARLSIAGTAVDPRFRFNVQFAFSRNDVDLETIGVVNTLADAVVTWNWTPSFFTSLGQTKVYGNRQSLTPVSEIEHVERSIVNATFALDRDAGLFAGYTRRVGNGPMQLRASLTSGDGRNTLVGDASLAYNARIDWQPLGAFRGNGAFSESDLLREPSTRLAVGASYTANQDAMRVGGSTGGALFEPSDISTVFIDAALKRRGFAMVVEYARRDADDPVTVAGDESRAVFAGSGITGQASYVTPRGWLGGVRVARVTPDSAIYGTAAARTRTQTSVELGRLLRGHRIKWLVELGRDDVRDPLTEMRAVQYYSRWSVLAGF